MNLDTTMNMNVNMSLNELRLPSLASHPRVTRCTGGFGRQQRSFLVAAPAVVFASYARPHPLYSGGTQPRFTLVRRAARWSDECQ